MYKPNLGTKLGRRELMTFGHGLPLFSDCRRYWRQRTVRTGNDPRWSCSGRRSSTNYALPYLVKQRFATHTVGSLVEGAVLRGQRLKPTGDSLAVPISPGKTGRYRTDCIR